MEGGRERQREHRYFPKSKDFPQVTYSGRGRAKIAPQVAYLREKERIPPKWLERVRGGMLPK